MAQNHRNPDNLPAQRDERGRFLPGHSLGGRPPDLDQGTAERVLAAVIQHGSLDRACERQPDLPDAATVRRWMSDSEDDMVTSDQELRARFREAMRIARETVGWRLWDEAGDAARACLLNPDKEQAMAVREFVNYVSKVTPALAPHVFAPRARAAAERSTDVSVAVQVVLPPKADGSS